MKLDSRIRKELYKRVNNSRVFVMWDAYIKFLHSCSDLSNNAHDTAVHHILWRAEYPQYIKSKWNLIRLSHENHTAAAALALAAEPKNGKLRDGFYATYKFADTSHRQWKPKNPQEIIRLYVDKFWSCQKIGKKFNADSGVVCRFLQRNDVKTRSSGEQQEWRPNKPEEIISQYKNGRSLMWLSKRYSKALVTIARFLRNNNVVLSAAGTRRWKPKSPQSVISSYESGMSAKKIGSSLGVTAARVILFLRRNGVKLRPGSAKIWQKRDEKRMLRLYLKEKWNAAKIGKEYGASEHCILDFLHRNKISLYHGPRNKD